MTNSIERPFSAHDPEEKTCAYCGDIFFATHGLQKYCPEKFGKIDFCKYEQKKMVSETKLLEFIKEVNSAVNPPVQRLNPLENNIHILETILGPNFQTKTDSDRLDSMGYQIGVFSRREFAGNSDYISLIVGPFQLRWTGTVGEILRFKITRL